MIRLVNQFDKSTTHTSAATPSCCCSCCCCCIATTIVSGLVTNRAMSQGALKTKTEISTLHRVGAYFSIPIALVVLVLVAQLTGLVHIISVYATIFVALAAYWAIQYFTLRHYVSNPILYATIMTIIAPFALAAEVFLWVMGMLA